MKRNIIWILCVVIFISIFAYFAQNLFMPPNQGNENTKPFWVVETSPANPQALTVFDISLGESSLNDVIFVFGNRLSLSIFEENGNRELEGYIRETHVGGITGRIPFNLSFNDEQIESVMPFLSPNKLSTTKRKIYDIPEEYHHRFYDNIVESIAFIPMAVNLDETVIIGRFGDNPIKLQEANKGAFHYLYPEKGVDISLDSTGEYRSVVQYVTPADFEEKVMTPLLDSGAEEVPLLQQ